MTEIEKVSKFDKASEDLKLLIRSRVPIIYIQSDEKEQQIIDVVHKMCEEGTSGSKFKKGLYVWDLIRGVTKLSINSNGKAVEEQINASAKDPVTALDFIAGHQGESKGKNKALDHVYIFCEMHHYFRDANVQRRLRYFSEYVVENERKCLIMLSTKNAGFQGKILPLELENIVYFKNWPYPDSIFIEKYLENSIIPALNEKFDKAGVETMNFDTQEMGELVNSCKGLTAKQISQATAKSAVKHRTLNPKSISKEKKQIIEKSGSVDLVEPDQKMEDIGGLDNLKDWLKKRKPVLSSEAIDFGCDLPKGILCIGPWGCGKTSVAKAIINEWGLPGLRIDVSRMFGMYVGESEARTKNMLDLADSIAPAVLWWDEVENIFTNYGGGGQGTTDGGTSSRVLGLISTWMSEHEGLVFNIFTANDISDSPPKLFRKGRLDEIFITDLPVKEERSEILRIHLKKRLQKQGRLGQIDEIDFGLLAEKSTNLSGAELEAAINSSMIECFSDGKRMVTTSDIEGAIVETIPFATTMEEKITKIRNWQEGRAKSASKYEPEDIMDQDEYRSSRAADGTGRIDNLDL